MNWKNIFNALLLCTLVVFSACKQDDIIINEPQEGDMRPISLAGPAARFNLSVFDFIDDLAENDIFVADDGVLYFQYREPVYINWENLVTLRDVDERWVFGIPDLASPLKATSNLPAFSQQVVLSHQDDVRYENVTLLSGELDLSVEVPPGYTGSIIVEIPQALTSDKEVFSVEFEADGMGGVASQKSMPVSLTDFHIVFANAEEIPYNSHIDVNVYPDLESGGFPFDEELAVNFSLTSLKKASAYGYFGDQTATSKDNELEFDVFEELDDLAGKVELSDFELDIEIYNSIGVSFYVEASNVRFFQKDSETPDSHLIIDNGDKAVIDYIPSALDTNPLTPGQANFVVSGSSSNLIEIGNTFPVRLMVDLFSRSNPPAPEGVVADNKNFIHIVDELQADLVIKLPFWFRATDYARTDTIDFDFLDIIDGSEDEVDHIDLAKIFFDFESTLPLSIVATAWVIDGQGEKINDLLSSGTYIIQSGTEGAPGESAFEIGLTSDQISLFKSRKAKEIVMSYALSTGDNDSEPVKIKQDAAIKAAVSFDFSGSIPN